MIQDFVDCCINFSQPKILLVGVCLEEPELVVVVAFGWCWQDDRTMVNWINHWRTYAISISRRRQRTLPILFPWQAVLFPFGNGARNERFPKHSCERCQSTSSGGSREAFFLLRRQQLDCCTRFKNRIFQWYTSQ